ncbi:MAG: hypothetical protein DRJ69_03810 [Thermoprotei archaeon]|nr:MAG: hypothetical protein DRJ69_03810 [Thermoprotei archaeon]
MKVEWSEEGCRWLIKRLGSTFIYVELSLATSQGRSVLKRSLVPYGKHGRRREVFAEEYVLEDAVKAHMAEAVLIDRLRLHPLHPSSAPLKQALRG